MVEQYKHYSKIKQDQFISRLLVEISVGTAPKPFAVFIFYRLTQMGLNKTCLNNQPSITKNNSLTKLERSFFLTKINELQLNFNEFNINETFLADYSDYWKVFRNEMGKMHTKYINKIGKHNENDNLNRKEFLYLLTELTKQILIGNTEHSQFNIGKKNTFEKPKDNQEYVNITPKKVKIGQ